MAASKEDDNWEEHAARDFQQLSIKHDKPEQSPAQAPLPDVKKQAKKSTAGEVDPAVIEALSNPHDRKTIGDLEEMVIKFIADTSREILEFPGALGTYQKMLAHRVAQAYGLYTSTVDYEEGPGRVIGQRTQQTHYRKVRLTKMELPQGVVKEMPVPYVGDRSNNGSGPKILRRPAAADTSPGDTMHTSNSSQSMKEREEDYIRARERIIGSGSGSNAIPAGRSGGGGRGSVGGGRDGSGRGRGRKAVFRDKDRELQDPDYVRGFHRDGAAQPSDPAAYGAMDGQHEYATHQAWGPGHAYGFQPPPPPPHPSSHHGGGQQHPGGKAAGTQGSASAAPPGAAMAMYPGVAPAAAAAGQPGMVADMVLPGVYPAGMPMAGPFPMAGYPGQMAYPGMSAQQAMYGPGMAYSYGGMQMAPSAYGYMAGGAMGQDRAGAMAAGAQGSYMYPPYMYTQQMAAAMQMQQQQGGGRPMAGMPGMPSAQGMEPMYYPAGQYAYMMPQGPALAPQPGSVVDGKQQATGRVQVPSSSGGAQHTDGAASSAARGGSGGGHPQQHAN